MKHYKHQKVTKNTKEDLRRSKPLSEPLLVEIHTDRCNVTPILWLHRLEEANMELAIGNTRSPGWVTINSTLTLEVVSPLDGERVRLQADVLDVERGVEGTSIFLRIVDLTLPSRVKLMSLVTRGTRPCRTVVDTMAPRARVARRLISGVRVCVEDGDNKTVVTRPFARAVNQ